MIPESDQLNLFDQYMHSLLRNFYLRPSLNGLRTEFSSSDVFACRVLGRKGKCTMSELADEWGLVLSTMTGVIDRLVAKGCVTRTRDDGEDRRKVFVELDRKGKTIYQQLLESEIETIIRVMESLDDQERDALLGVLGKAVGALKNQ